MNKRIRQALIIITITFLGSCTLKKPKYKSSNSKRIIIIETDKTIRYSEIFGGIGTSGTLNYKKQGKRIKIEGIKGTEQEGYYRLATDLIGAELIVEKDSLVIENTKEVFYSKGYLKKERKNQFIILYIIHKGNKLKITKWNGKRILKKIDFDKYTIVEISDEKVKNKYGINQNHKAFELLPK